MENKPTFGERALYLLSPERGQQAYAKRIRKERDAKAEGPSRDKVTQSASGYGAHGASRTANALAGWIVNGGAAEDDIDLQSATLRQRSRDLYAGGGLGKSGPDTLNTAVVGWGIYPKPNIDGEMLGISDEEAANWERKTLKEFQLWAGNTMCDAERSKNFYAMQQLAFLSKLVSGDLFVLFGQKENKRTPYTTVIRLLEADRISTPDTNGDSQVKETGKGNRIVDGVEISQDGEVLRYYIASRHPLQSENSESVTWTAVDAYGKDTGYANILHISTFERPEQRRGIPFVSAQIEKIKQLDRYINSELAANVVSSMLTAFVISDADDGKMAMEDAVNEDEKVTEDDLQLELAPGAIYDLPPGKKIDSVNPLRSNTGFESFVTTMEILIGSGYGIPKEVLVHKYDSNYTASRSAMLDFWRSVRKERAGFNAAFNQPIYEQWLAEAVARGRIDAPGFFDDPAIRQAWCGCDWIGASMGHVDPKKEAEAAAMRVAMNISSQELEASEYNGGNWNEIVRQRIREEAAMKRIGNRETEKKTADKEEEEEDGESEKQV